MSPKEAIWLSEYLQCLNATEAARRADYKWPNKKGPELKGKFAEEIKAILSDRIPSPEAIVSRVADIATADITNYLLPDGRLDVEKMRESGRGHLLKKYKINKTRSTRKDGSEYESETVETELYPADGALDKLMRYHGLYDDRVRIEDWQSDIIDMLRTGRLTPADVKTAFPDLAAEFFARAGVSANSDKDE
jgi:phage terminase small subunit